MLRFIINVGLNVQGVEAHNATEVWNALESRSFRVKRANVQTAKSGERTFVALVEDMEPWRLQGTRQRLHHMAVALQQECVAVCPLLGQTALAYLEHGALIGPLADKWGNFDPQFFIQE